MMKNLLFFLLQFSMTMVFAESIDTNESLYFNMVDNKDYSAPISLPTCDSEKQNVLIIRTIEDFENISSNTHDVFCVLPGDYRNAGNIEITSDGTKKSPKVLRYYNPDQVGSVHPAQQSTTLKAIVESITLSGVDYWVIDGISVIDTPKGTNPILMEKQSSFNILNRVLVERFVDNGILIKNGSNFNVIQNSLIGNMLMKEGVDHVCIGLEGRSVFSDVVIKGTRVVNNEIYNCNDGFMTITDPRLPWSSDFPETIIANNDIYITDAMYSDCTGNKDTKGFCACTENAIDLKGGSSIKKQPILIVDNYMWGWKKTDKKCGGSGSWGEAIAAHFGVENLIIKNNIIFNSSRGLSLVDQLKNINVSGNVFHTIIETHENTGFAMVFSQSKNNRSNNSALVEKNIVVNTTHFLVPSLDNLTVRNNIFINAGDHPFGAANNLSAYSNRYYKSKSIKFEKYPMQIKPYDVEVGFGDLCFIIQRFSNPKEKCLIKAKPL